ncbi:MAG: carbonic anhydrase family protein [Gammaproteobacteria bacterium]|nr:carbonic anhydrase family protein [Gammaproteobacteria bacterium]
MNKLSLTALAASLVAANIACAGGPATHWGYVGHDGPEHWGELDPAYQTCAVGKNQSPIDLTAAIDAELPALGFDYATLATEILNNGHTVQANFAPGSTLEVDGRRFALKQVHFHSPSENAIDGKPCALEAHFVHADADGNLAVVAVMFDEGPENATLTALWNTMPEQAGERHALQPAVAVDAMMPVSRDYYRFTGSLTTPPCSEGVIWLVLKDEMTASRAQIARFASVMHHPNNRPLQPINARVVLR